MLISGRQPAKLEAAVADVRGSGGTRIRGILADAASAEGSAASLAAQDRGDILVNNLGAYESKSLAETE